MDAAEVLPVGSNPLTDSPCDLRAASTQALLLLHGIPAAILSHIQAEAKEEGAAVGCILCWHHVPSAAQDKIL